MRCRLMTAFTQGADASLISWHGNELHVHVGKIVLYVRKRDTIHQQQTCYQSTAFSS